MSAINASEIHKGDLVRVLTSEDGLEDLTWAVVGMNTGRVLGVHYLNETERTYKGAAVWELDEEMSPAEYATLSEHWPEGTLSDVHFHHIGENLYASLDEIDPNDDDSEVWSVGSSNTSLSGFITSDSSVGDEPDNARAIDREWDSWRPLEGSGGRSFKDTIDAIEERIRARSTSAPQ